MIERMTPEQARELIPFREEQRRRALSTETIDCTSAIAAVNRLYEAGGCEKPRLVLFFTSPAMCLLARGVLMRLSALRSQLESQLRSQLGSQLESQLESQLGSQLRSQLGSQLRSQLRSQLGSQLESQLESQLWSQLESQLWSQLSSQLWSQLSSQLVNGDLHQELWFIGGWDRFWLAFYEFARRIGMKLAPKLTAHFDAYQEYADTCGVAYFYPQVAFVSDRPERISFDSARRLHADDGPALKFRDGYSVYAWKGMRVDASLIEKRHEITTDQIKAERNAEQRRVLMEIYAHLHGPGRIVADMKARLMSEDVSHGRPRKLYEIDGNRFLHVINGSLEPDGSRREFLLGAHPDAMTPHDAVAASYGRPAAKYREAVRS